VNRFDKEGEGLYLARSGGQLHGVGGLNRDPYGESPEIGRVRRLYGLAEHRRQGVGRALMDRWIQEARKSFGELRLRAGSADAAAFFVGLGFKTTRHLADSTHRLRLR
jgi:GNAT superfamily N-acetyltransferase